MLPWDAITAISSAASTIVIGATIVVGYRQIRVAGDQLEHLRSSAQFDGTLKIFAELEAARFRAATRFVENELALYMRDAQFRDELLASHGGLDQNEHQEFLVAGTFEKIGTYARHGMLDTVLMADYCGPLIRSMWCRLEACGYIELRRQTNPYIYENFEFLYDAAMDWYENTDPPFRTKRARSTGSSSVSERVS
jgi:hypothetical protein